MIPKAVGIALAKWAGIIGTTLLLFVGIPTLVTLSEYLSGDNSPDLDENGTMLFPSHIATLHGMFGVLGICWGLMMVGWWAFFALKGQRKLSATALVLLVGAAIAEQLFLR